MNYADEQRIARAVRQRDPQALADAVKNLPRYNREYDEVVNVIDPPGATHSATNTSPRAGRAGTG